MRALLVILMFAPLAAAQLVPVYPLLPEPQPFPDCDTPDAVLFDNVDGAGFENLHFQDGQLYVTAFERGLYHAGPDDALKHIVDGPGEDVNPLIMDNDNYLMGVTGSNGVLYVTQGQSVATPVEAQLLRFDNPGSPEFVVHADGFDGLNGVASDADGNVYAAHGFREGVYKILPDGSWSLWLDMPGVNGVSLHPDGERLVVAAFIDTGSRVVSVSLDDPTDRETLFQFAVVSQFEPAGAEPSREVVPNLADDVAVASDGRVLTTSHERLQTLMGDPSTGEACVLFDGHVGAPTSVRVAEEFGNWTGHAFMTDTNGDVWTVDLGLVPEEPEATGDLDDAASTDDAGDKDAPTPGIIAVVGALMALAGIQRKKRA